LIFVFSLCKKTVWLTGSEGDGRSLQEEDRVEEAREEEVRRKARR
jgi:hypothetical protein